MREFIIVALIGYCVGGFQTAYILGRLFKKIDIRSYGNSNAGASNATKVMGWKYGIVIALVDILKAVLAVIIARNLYTDSSSVVLFIAGLFTILGHVYPVLLKFRGGKGTASLVGMMFAIDFKIGLLLVASIIIVTLITDYIALGTITMVIIMPIIISIAGYPLEAVLICVGIAMLSIYKHLPNVKNIINKKEPGLRGTLKK